MMGYSLRLPSSYDKEFSSLYLKADYLIGKITDYKSGKGDYDNAIVNIQSIANGYTQKKAQGKLLCYIKVDSVPLEIGDVIQFKAKLLPIKNKNNPGEFNAELYWKTKGINTFCFLPSSSISVLQKGVTFTKFWDQSRAHLIQIIQKYISPSNQGSVIGLTMGDKSELSNQQQEEYANAGAMYLLAVAGLHIGILLRFLEWFFSRIKVLRKKHLYLYSSIAAVWAISFLTGMSASVLRASTMFSILAIGQLLGRRYFSMQAIFASALFLLIIDPFFLFDVGFQLSYAAIIGIGLFYYPLSNYWQPKNKIINLIWQGLIVGIAAEIGVIPLSLFYFHQFPNYFMLTTIVVTLLAFVGMVSVVLFITFSFVPYLVNALAFVVDLIFDLLNYFIHFINQLPAKISTGFSPTIVELLLIYSSILLLYLFWKKRSYRPFILTAIVLFAFCTNLLVEREYNKTKQELVVLNNRQKVVFIKENHQFFVVYDNSDNSINERLINLSKSYQKSNGITAVFLPLTEFQRLSLNKEINLSELPNGMAINYYQHHYLLANKPQRKGRRQKFTLIKGEWNPYLKTKRPIINTLNAAFITSPNH